MFVPRKSFVCDKLLEEEGVYGHVILEDLKLDLIPFDEDIISMELPLFFKSVVSHFRNLLAKYDSWNNISP